MADDMTTVQEAPAPPAVTIKDRAVTASQNIADTDKVAVLVVVQADDQVRVTAIGASKTEAVQTLCLGSVVMAKMLQVAPVAQSSATA